MVDQATAGAEAPCTRDGVIKLLCFRVVVKFPPNIFWGSLARDSITKMLLMLIKMRLLLIIVFLMRWFSYTSFHCTLRSRRSKLASVLWQQKAG